MNGYKTYSGLLVAGLAAAFLVWTGAEPDAEQTATIERSIATLTEFAALAFAAYGRRVTDAVR